MTKDHQSIIVYLVASVTFTANMVVAFIAGSTSHAAMWAFSAACFGAAAYLVWRRSRNEK